MATKDWKKIAQNKTLYRWNNQIIFRDIIVFKLGKKWRVEYPSEKNEKGTFTDTNVKEFKTKSQALKYAKAYMRKN